MKRRDRVQTNELYWQSQFRSGRAWLRGGIITSLVIFSLWAGAARAASFGVDWIDMSSIPVGSTVPSGSVFAIPGYGSVTITYTGSLNRTHDQLAAAQNVNGPLSIGSDTYQWMTFDGLFQVNPAGGSSTPLTYSITYTFSGLPIPPDELVLGVWGLGRSNQADPDLISTVTVLARLSLTTRPTRVRVFLVVWASVISWPPSSSRPERSWRERCRGAS